MFKCKMKSNYKFIILTILGICLYSNNKLSLPTLLLLVANLSIPIIYRVFKCSFYKKGGELTILKYIIFEFP